MKRLYWKENRRRCLVNAAGTAIVSTAPRKNVTSTVADEIFLETNVAPERSFAAYVGIDIQCEGRHLIVLSHYEPGELAMADVLFIGGPLHGQKGFVPELLSHVHIPGKDPHHLCNATPLIPELKPCLELEEIKALTGRSNHRENRVLKEEFERQDLLMHSYRHTRWLRDGIIHDLYVDTKLDGKMANQLIRELMATPQKK
jgi:hypothetical protein